ncbi:hypothetical protein, variant [Verruconis gallopava]|uniref:Uncharacterized protein n=1 Tax=Verruconis gallopava TaxID=253628 RepID=A0A0D1XAD4_9PEZI|nr:hypothetical protein, variant [Verruconis gallopava]KIV99155.1 hypothetical protein, variant [Verruconis gallopava]
MIPAHFKNISMWPLVMHHCKSCGYETPVAYTASVFSEPQYCNHCDSASIGVSIRAESELVKMQAADMRQQDELAGLFARTMTFSNPTPPPEEKQQPKPPSEEPRKIYASMHYVPPTSFSLQTPQSSPEPETRPLSDNEIAEMLVQNGIDPHSLFPSQVSLFRNAEADQRNRLMELWRISPPNLGAYDIAKEQATWLETTLQREEEVARLKYERAVIEAQGIGSPHDAIAAVDQISRPASAPEARSPPATSGFGASTAEPYMTTGYEMLAQREYDRSEGLYSESATYRQATDPAYRGGGNWNKNMQDMENSYGAYAAAREQSGMASLNGLDEDMVM